MKKNLYVIVISLIAFSIPTVCAQTANEFKPTHKLSGLIYSDYYSVINHHIGDLKGKNGFWARRVYLAYDSKFAEKLSARVRLEMNSPGDFSTNQNLDPFVKDLYLNWSMNQNHSLIAGLSSTPTLGLVESVWGYRSVEKSPSDLHKFGSSRDFGIALQGQLGEGGNLKYHAMVGNGSGTGAETNKWKKFMLSLGWWFNDNMVVEVYGEYNRTGASTTQKAIHGFLGYVSENINAGAMYVTQFNTLEVNGNSDQTETLDLVSAFTNFKLAQKWTAFLRTDHMFKANPRGPSIDYIPFSDQAKSTFLTYGVDFNPVPNLHVIPNFETVIYGDAPNGSSPTNDLIFRATLYYVF